MTAPTLASAKTRVTFSAIVGVIVGGVAALVVPWEAAVLAGWDAAAALFVARVWRKIHGMNGTATKRAAGPTDLSRRIADPILTGASIGCLVGVAFTLLKASNAEGTGKAGLVAIAVFSVVASWLVVQTMYTLRYADLYYSADEGGISFNEGDALPAYMDFAYVAFTLGMTYQVSDTNVTKTAIRRAALGHALLSFLFGTFILATTINVVASLLNS
jgi:uncharacterized membrane protein